MLSYYWNKKGEWNDCKADYKAKINEIENKITTAHDHNEKATTQEFIKLTLEHFAARLEQANSASKTDILEIIDFVKKTDLDNKLKNLNRKITSNKAWHI